MAEILVPDTSVLVDGRITQLLAEDYPGATVIVPWAALSELEAQANNGQETGFAGLAELEALQRMAREETISVRFSGARPGTTDIEQAAAGAIDALIRDVAVAEKGILVTSDRVQAHAAAAQGLRHHYVRPIVDEHPDLEHLAVSTYFGPDVMSVHLKADCIPMAKRGTPGSVVYGPIGTKATPHTDLRAMARECIEFAKRDYASFLELQRHGCTVCQLGPMRVTIAQPPFSDGLEITAVRPVRKTTIADYELPPEVLQRVEGKARGVFVAGPPGSGKSTFAAAVAEHLHGMDRVVKTMEQPRDLQVPKEITQYGALDHDMAWTGEVMLLVRPDHVVYDEVRTTDDFRVFADMRLAGIGLFGVTHANRPIDAVQRLIGRVDLGMIPQVVDTVVFIDAGQVTDVLELHFTVKTPEGMTEPDLARPVVLVRDLRSGKGLYELYSFGEQIVVMPLEQISGDRPSTGAAGLAEKEVERTLRRYVRGPVEVQVRGDKATVLVAEAEVPGLIGKGGRTVQGLERRLGMSLDIRPLDDRRTPPKGMAARPPPGGDAPRFRTTGSNVFLDVGRQGGGRRYVVEVEGAVVGEATASQQGRLRFKRNSPEGKALEQAFKAGMDITCRTA